jgi:hypothetical protein
MNVLNVFIEFGMPIESNFIVKIVPKRVKCELFQVYF